MNTKRINPRTAGAVAAGMGMCLGIMLAGCGPLHAMADRPGAPQSAAAQDVVSQASAKADREPERLLLGLSKSAQLQLPRDAADILLSDPAIVEAVVRTPRRIYLIGKALGEARVFITDAHGAQIMVLDVSVAKDLRPLSAIIERLIPGSSISLEGVSGSVILTGSVRTPGDAVNAAAIARRYIGGADDQQVLNLLSVETKEQVLLKVTVAEINRSAVQRLGIDIGEVAARAGHASFSAATGNSFALTSALAAPGAGLAGLIEWRAGDARISAILDALERGGLARTLAEPNLTAVSGETATFLAGGEFPVPVASDERGISVTFRQFGIGLAFTPLVMSEGRIVLKISVEVSELSSDGAVQTGEFSIPALRVRRASTTVELSSGGAIMIAGLISEQTRRQLDGIPGLRELPMLGALFSSEEFIRSQSELVILVSPVLVSETQADWLAVPEPVSALEAEPHTDGFIIK